MTSEETSPRSNPLAAAPVGRLIGTYSLPAIASSLVSSIYNIVDQIFVGRSIGELGNAATNVAFPLVMIITTAAMIFGAGGASAFSLHLGRKEEQRAKGIVGTAMTLLLSTGVLLTVLASIFLRPMLTFFGGRGQTLEYAIEYTRILALGAPMAMLETGMTRTWTGWSSGHSPRPSCPAITKTMMPCGDIRWRPGTADRSGVSAPL